MKAQKQLFHHRPDQGEWGDCWRTVLACLLDVAPEEVPHFNEGSPEGVRKDPVKVDVETRTWLARRGITLVGVRFNGDVPLETVLNSAGEASHGLHYILSGTSRTGVNHCVIGHGNEITWDPSLTDAGIVGPLDDGTWWVEWLVMPAKLRVAA